MENNVMPCLTLISLSDNLDEEDFDCMPMKPFMSIPMVKTV